MSESSPFNSRSSIIKLEVELLLVDLALRKGLSLASRAGRRRACGCRWSGSVSQLTVVSQFRCLWGSVSQLTVVCVDMNMVHRARLLAVRFTAPRWGWWPAGRRWSNSVFLVEDHLWGGWPGSVRVARLCVSGWEPQSCRAAELRSVCIRRPYRMIQHTTVNYPNRPSTG